MRLGYAGVLKKNLKGAFNAAYILKFVTRKAKLNLEQEEASIEAIVGQEFKIEFLKSNNKLSTLCRI